MPHGQSIPVPSPDPPGRTARLVPRGKLSSSIRIQATNVKVKCRYVQIGMAYAASLNGNQNFILVGFWPFDFFDRARTLEFVENGGSHKEGNRLGLGGPQEELHRTAHTLAQLVRPRQIHGPLADDSVKKPFHEFRNVHNWKSARHISAFLALCEYLSEQADAGFLGSPHVG